MDNSNDKKVASVEQMRTRLKYMTIVYVGILIYLAFSYKSMAKEFFGVVSAFLVGMTVAIIYGYKKLND